MAHRLSAELLLRERLRGIGLEQYAEIMMVQGYDDLADFVNFTPNDLSRMMVHLQEADLPAECVDQITISVLQARLPEQCRQDAPTRAKSNGLRAAVGRRRILLQAASEASLAATDLTSETFPVAAASAFTSRAAASSASVQLELMRTEVSGLEVEVKEARCVLEQRRADACSRELLMREELDACKKQLATQKQRAKDAGAALAAFKIKTHEQSLAATKDRAAEKDAERRVADKHRASSDAALREINELRESLKALQVSMEAEASRADAAERTAAAAEAARVEEASNACAVSVVSSSPGPRERRVCRMCDGYPADGPHLCSSCGGSGMEQE